MNVQVGGAAACKSRGLCRSDRRRRRAATKGCPTLDHRDHAVSRHERRDAAHCSIVTWPTMSVWDKAMRLEQCAVAPVAA